ncbi:MAG: hypothetical protein AAF416_03920 [Pseudomonadota bacterium]
MNRLDTRIIDVLEPVRDLAVGELLETIARTLDEGHTVHAEPKARDRAGQVLREGRLALPSRRDLLVRHAGGSLTREIQGPGLLQFEPITLVEPDGFVCVIGPFRWDSALVVLERAEAPAAPACEAAPLPQGADMEAAVEAASPIAEPDWRPLRRWFLEWFQSRFSDEAPDLDGAVHAMYGPEDVPVGWRLRIDLGSAPVEALNDLVGALAATGAARVRIGESN